MPTPTPTPTPTPFTIETPAGRVGALLDGPDRPSFVYVLAHGAGAGMTHAFLADVAGRLATAGVATLRYNFPYMDAHKNRVDSPEVATATVRAAVLRAGDLHPGVPLIAGGKSFGGRMTSQAQALAPLPGVRGLAFLGFPLHPPGKPGIERAEPLDRIAVPLLFLQGTRDEFAQLELLRPVVARCASATLVLTEDGDHSFKVRKSSGQPQSLVMQSLVDTLVQWATPLVS